MYNETPKWYIATTIIGNEDIVYKNIEDKIRAYGLNDLVKQIKLLKSREITIEIFDNKNNPPPKSMRNTKSITWETLPGNRYKKTRIREINRFPGYIYIEMIMTQEAWYAIRNTYGITGFVGSSGKGAQPIPMSDFEVENLFNEENNKDIINVPDGYNFENDNFSTSSNFDQQDMQFSSQQQNNKVSKVEFFDTPQIISVNNKPFVVKLDDDGYFNTNNAEEIKDNSNSSIASNTELNNEISSDTSDSTITDLYLDDDSDEDNKKQNQTSDKSSKDNTIKVGTIVKIVKGSLSDTIGHVLSIDNDSNQLEIEIEILGKKNNVKVNMSDISLDDIENN